MPSLQQLTSPDALLAAGISLCFVGIILRGFARDSLRARARRQQEWLHRRQPGEVEAPDSAGWFEHNLSLIANTTAAAGVVITLLSLWHR